MNVIIVTWCKTAEAFYGNSLVFESLRTGFPTANVTLVDNGSLPCQRERLQALAIREGARFIQVPEVPHWALLGRALQQATGPLCFVDPDIIFWDKVEDWTFDGKLLAGRLLPTFRDEYTQSLTQARLHTSLLFVPDPPRLRERIAQIQRTQFDFDPFRPIIAPLANGWLRWDSAATLYGAVQADAHAFTAAQLDTYDHLFCGTHAHLVRGALGPRFGQFHDAVRDGERKIKGVWREQEAHFQQRAKG